MPTRPIAVITGAASSIGLELAQLAAHEGYDLVIAANEPLSDAMHTLKQWGARIDAIETDLTTPEGVQALLVAIGSQHVALFCAVVAPHQVGAPHGRGPIAIRSSIDPNDRGTTSLMHQIGRRMRAQRSGRILVTSTAAPSTAFLDAFAFGLREERRETVPSGADLPGFGRTRWPEPAFVKRGEADLPGSTQPPRSPAAASHSAKGMPHRHHGRSASGHEAAGLSP